MGLLDRLGRESSTSGAADLVGVWHLVRSDILPPGEAELDIGDDGRLLYSIRDGDKWQIMRLTYRIEGDTIVSNQPSAPREERFRRGEKRAPRA